MGFRSRIIFIILLLLLIISSQEPIYAEENIDYKYSIEAKLLPRSLELVGKYSAFFEVKDTLLACGFSIYAPEKGNNSRYYFSDTVKFYEDPLIERMYGSFIEVKKLLVDGKEIDVSMLEREGEFIKIAYQNSKPYGAEIHVETEFMTQLFDCKDDIIFAVDWFPLIKTENDENYADIPKMFKYVITFPKNYKFIPSGFIEDTLYADDLVSYHVFDPYRSDALWLASPKITLLKEEDLPISYKLYSTCCNYPEGAIDQMEDQFRKLYEYFGSPVGDKQELYCILMPVYYPGLGGFNSGNIVVINSKYYKSAILSNLFDDILLHELLHYWWLNRVYGNISEGDALFHESFVHNMIRFLGKDTLAVEKKRERGWFSRMFGFLSKIDTWTDLSPARGGYHFSIFRSRDVDELDKLDKGCAALNAIANVCSVNVWEKKIYEYFKAVKGKQPITFELFCNLNPDIGQYLISWFDTPYDFDYAIKSVKTVTIKQSYCESIVEVENGGGIVTPCPVLLEYVDGSSSLDTVVVSNQVNTIHCVSRSPVKRVTLDPDHKVPDYDRSNNKNYKKVGFGISLSPFTNDGYKISTFPIALPAYSEITGWDLQSRIITISSPRISFGIAGGGSSHYIGIGCGYNFRSDRLIWNIRYSNPIHYPTKFSIVGFEVDDTPEHRSFEINLVTNKSKDFYSYPLRRINVFLNYSKYYRASYREGKDWTTGNNISIGASYTYYNCTTLIYPVKGHYFCINAKKSFDIWNGEWNYESLSGEMSNYFLLPHLLVLANRLFMGNIWGFTPIQDRLDLGRDALFISYPVYDETGYRLIALDTELRIRKRLPVFDLAVFYRNAWIKDYSINDYRHTYEIGIGLRALLLIPLVLDISLLRQSLDGNLERTPVYYFKLGMPFSYSQTGYRWNNR